MRNKTEKILFWQHVQTNSKYNFPHSKSTKKGEFPTKNGLASTE